MINRRTICIATLAGAGVLVAPRAFANATFWEKLGDTLGKGIALFIGVEKATDGIQKTDYPASERNKVVDEINQVITEAAFLYESQSAFINLLERYVVLARQSPASTQLKTSWTYALSESSALLGKVERVQKTLGRSTRLKKRFDSATLEELDQLLRQRTTLLDQLSSMPAPSSPDELAALERLAERYGLLHQHLESLMRSLRGARDRLASV
jgi:hypothetical protein